MTVDPASLNVPKHIAIIMDGNGRWAQRRAMPRIEGHRRGAKTVDRITREGARLGLERLTLYAFSMENWKRPEREVKMLMELLKDYLRRFHREMNKEGVRLTAIGRIDMLPPDTLDVLREVIEATATNQRMNLCLALSYGGRTEIVDAARRLVREVQEGALRPGEIDEDAIAQRLYQPGPDPDLIIRTAGEMRLSNFLLWEASYAEFYSTEVCWPAFKEEQLHEAIREYNQRTRKYGGLIKTGKENDS